MEKVYEYETSEYAKDIPIDEEDSYYPLRKCPRCNSWRIISYTHRVCVCAQTPEGAWDFDIEYNRDEPEKDYYECYDCAFIFNIKDK